MAAARAFEVCAQAHSHTLFAALCAPVLQSSACLGIYILASRVCAVISAICIRYSPPFSPRRRLTARRLPRSPPPRSQVTGARAPPAAEASSGGMSSTYPCVCALCAPRSDCCAAFFSHQRRVASPPARAGTHDKHTRRARLRCARNLLIRYVCSHFLRARAS